MTVRDRVQRLRPWLALAGAVLAVGVLVPPGGTAASQHVFAQAVQFAVLAIAAPALVVLGAPWRLLAGLLGRGGTNLADGVAIARSHRRSRARPVIILMTFIVVALAWRLPVAVNAVVRYPALTAGEAVSLIGTGCALWLELVESPPFLPRITRPQRAPFPPLPMGAPRARAYLTGLYGTC